VGRTLWIAIGAAGGILAYRKGQQLLEEAKHKGVVGSLQAATGSASGLAQGTRTLVERALAPQPTDARDLPGPSRPSGTAAARALAQSRNGDGTRVDGQARMLDTADAVSRSHERGSR
jgi:hypothetical protein